jgi:hypothetical protein
MVRKISHLRRSKFVAWLDMFRPTDLRPLTQPGQACVFGKKGVRQSRGMGPVPRDQETISDHG